MQRRERVALLDGLHDFVSDDNGPGKLFTAVNDAVTDGVDLLHRTDDAVLFIDQRIEHGLDGLIVRGHGDGGLLDRFFARQLGLVGKAAVDADALAQTLGKQLARGGVEQLVLQRGRTRVDDQNIHK